METVVKMSNSIHGVREFTISHAESLLAYQAKYGLEDWKISDPNFTFENGIIVRTNKGATNKPEKQSSDTESN